MCLIGFSLRLWVEFPDLLGKLTEHVSRSVSGFYILMQKYIYHFDRVFEALS